MKPIIMQALALAAVLTAAADAAPPQGNDAKPVPTGHYADINGLRMYYEIHGSGMGEAATPLVLLHGAFATIEGWGTVLPTLAKTHQVIAIELQGHGHTNDLDRPLTYEQMADDTAALLKQLKIAKADVFGYSMGGIVGLGVAIRHPELVRKLAILGSCSDRLQTAFEPETYKHFQSLSADFAPPVLKDPYDKVAPDPTRWPVLVRKIKAMGHDFQGYSASDVGSIKAQVLIMQGDRDGVRPEHAVAVYRLISDGAASRGVGPGSAQLAIFPGGDHFMLWHSPDTVLATLTPFLAAPLPTHVTGSARTQGNKQTVTSKDGTRIAFDQTGKGPVLILVAGALSDRSSGARLAALLAPHFTVINYDRRGRGGSGDTQPYAVQREVEDIEALIDAAGGSAFLFGSSSGAVLALEATSRLPGKVKQAALFEPPFIVDDSRPPVPGSLSQRAAELVSTGRRSDAVEYFMTVAVGLPPEAVAQMKKAPMWAGLEKLAHTLVYDGAIMDGTIGGQPLPARRWSAVTTPMLVIDGGRSDAWLRHSAQALADVLPNAQRRTLEGQDHSVTFMAPQVLVPVLVEFFDGNESTP